MKKSLAVFFALAAFCGFAADIYVDYNSGKKNNPGTKAAPMDNVLRAIKKAKPGDTVYILPSPTPIRDHIRLQNVCGTPDKPITIDGMNNIFIGTEPLDPKVWKEYKPGIYTKRVKTGYNWASRYYMTFNGKMNRMGRLQKSSKASAPFKKLEDLAPGEWTIIKAEQVGQVGPHKQFNFDYYVRLPEGATNLADSGVEEPLLRKTEGVMVRGTTSNVIIRNTIVKNFHNDGYNIHGKCNNIHFENVAAIYCGDDGISAHEACSISLKNAVFIGCATAICHVQEARCTHENVYAEKINGRELYFLGNTYNTLKDIYFISDSASGCTWVCRKKDECQTGSVENVIAVCNNPKGVFEITGAGKVDVKFTGIEVADFGKVSKHDGITVAPKADLLKKIANAKAKLFAIFGGNLEKALR